MNIFRSITSKVLIIALAIWLPSLATAQQKKSSAQSQLPENNVISRIEEESEGNIEIEIPDQIEIEILSQPQQSSAPSHRNEGQTTQKKGANRANGYRIMVFSDGRNPATLQSRARARGNIVASRFPKYRGQVYAYSKSPNWYCTVGNFRTSAEANAALGELKRAFPQFASEMRVVQSQITVK